MMKKLLVPVLAALFFISCNSSSSDNTVRVPVQKDITTTFMVYLPGTDLEANPNTQQYDGSGSGSLISMMKADNSSKLNIIVQTGAADVDYNTFTPQHPYVTPVKDWRTVQRHKITKGTITKLQTVGKSCLNKKDAKDCIEMGTPEALAEFIRYSATNYPADRYILVLWDHGNGPTGGYGSGAVKSMSMNDMIKAFESVKDIKFDIIGFDACIMASLEIAYNLKKYGKYLLASEEVEPGKGWNYGAPLNAIANNPNISNSVIGKITIDEYILANTKSNLLTLSLVDLSQVDAIVTELGKFSIEALRLFNSDKHNQWIKLFTARSRTDEFQKDPIGKGYMSLVDIGDFSDILKVESADYSASMTSLKSALKKAVVHNRTDATHKPSQGLSVYFPFHFGGEPSVSYAMDEYNNIYYPADKQEIFNKDYRDLLTTLVNYAVNTPSTLKIGTQSTTQPSYFSAEVTSNFNIDTSILLADVSAVGSEVYQVLTSVPATVVNTQQPDKFNIVAKIENKALALNGTLTYMSLEGRHALYSQSVYSFSIPAYVLDYDAEDRDINNAPLAMLSGYFDFSKGTGTINDTAVPLNATKRNGIYLQEGVQIMLPETFIVKTGENAGDKTYKKTKNIIKLDAKGNEGIAFTMEPLGANARLGFYVTDLKGTGKVSSLFKANGTPALRTLEIDGTTDDLEAFARGLMQSVKE